MAFLDSIDITVPTEGSSTVASLNDAQRAMRSATKNTVEVQHDLSDGRHKIPTGNSSAVPTIQVGDFYLSTDEGLLFIGKDGSNWTLGGDLEYGTRISIVQATIPNGWTLVTGFDDKVMIAEDTQSEGGDTSGSWTVSGLTVDAHTHTTTATGSNANESSHTHSFSVTSGTPSAQVTLEGGTPATAAEVNHTHSVSGTTAAGAAHTHTFSGNAVASGNASANTLTSAGSWRPAYVKVLVISKDTTVA